MLFYALITITILWGDSEEEGSHDRFVAMLFFKGLVVFTALFTLWRFGIAFMIEDKINPKTVSEFFINIVLIVFGGCVCYAFYKNTPWLKKAILILILGCFLSLTFIICPYLLHESELSDNTLYQSLIVLGIFGVPEGIAYKRKKAQEKVLEKKR